VNLVKKAINDGAGKIWLVWEHKTIPDLAKKIYEHFGLHTGDLPSSWPGKCCHKDNDPDRDNTKNAVGCYDKVWTFDTDNYQGLSEWCQGFAGDSGAPCNIYPKDDPTPPAPAPAPGPLPWGDVIRPVNDGSFCLDLPGGDTTPGRSLWLWECNGLSTQVWNWVDGAVMYGDDNSKCVDLPGGDFSDGNILQLWDCNGLPSQVFGYDEEMLTMYLGSSSSADASVCVDVAGGNVYAGAPVEIWGCNGYQNQQWWLGYGSAVV